MPIPFVGVVGTWIGTQAAAHAGTALLAAKTYLTATVAAKTFSAMTGTYVIGKMMQWKCSELKELYSSCLGKGETFDCALLWATKTTACSGSNFADASFVFQGAEEYTYKMSYLSTITEWLGGKK